MRPFLTVPEVADELDFHPETIRQWCRKHHGTFAVHIGQEWRIKREAYEALKAGQPLDTLNAA
jgi:excisionase family DNA binding protein